MRGKIIRGEIAIGPKDLSMKNRLRILAGRTIHVRTEAEVDQDVEVVKAYPERVWVETFAPGGMMYPAPPPPTMVERLRDRALLALHVVKTVLRDNGLTISG
jgi:hypothetical protein